MKYWPVIIGIGGALALASVAVHNANQAPEQLEALENKQIVALATLEARIMRMKREHTAAVNLRFAQILRERDILVQQGQERNEAVGSNLREWVLSQGKWYLKDAGDRLGIELEILANNVNGTRTTQTALIAELLSKQTRLFKKFDSLSEIVDDLSRPHSDSVDQRD